MIHAFALEPELVATWGRREEFRFVNDKFGLGAPRVLLELPKFTKWKRAVYSAANELGLLPEDMKRIEELFKLFSEHRCRRAHAEYDGGIPWLENAEREFARKPYAGILAAINPRGHPGVLVADQLDQGDSRWAREVACSPSRTPEALAAAISAMLRNCKEVHLIDPYFGPESLRHRTVLEAIMVILAGNDVVPRVVRVHCKDEISLQFFESEAARMANRLPAGMTVEFVRWSQRDGGEKLHNRYVLTDIGGVVLGVGLDEGSPGETDDLMLMSRSQHNLRWSQYVEGKGFDCVDCPRPVVGARR